MHIAQQWSGSGPFGPDPDPERKEGRVPDYSTLYKHKTYDIFQWNAQKIIVAMIFCLIKRIFFTKGHLEI